MPLSEENRLKLDGIVSQMEANREKPEDIQFVVNDFKTKYEGAGQSTGMGNLKVAEQRIGEPAVEKPNMASPENLARAAAVGGGGGFGTSMGIPAKAQTEAAAQYGRIVPAVIAAPMTAGMSLPAAAATLATVGGLSEAGAQGLELASDNREQMEPGKIAGAAVRSGVPISRFANPVLRVGANVGGQIAGNLAGKTLEKGGELPTPEEAIVEAAVPTAMAGAGRVVQAAVRGGGRLSGAVADLFRPYELTPEQLRGIRSRETVRTITGQEVPIGLAEAIDSGTLTRRMGLEGAEPTPEKMAQISELVLHTAARSGRSGNTPQEISRQVFDILDPQRRGIQGQVRQAVDRFSNQASRSVRQAEQQVRAAGQGFFPPGRSVSDIGNEIGEIADTVNRSAQTEWNAAYSAARAMPEYQTIPVDFQPVINRANAMGLSFVRDASGNISAMAAPAGARTAVDRASQLENTVSIEQARQFVSELGRNLRNSNFMPGVDSRVRADLMNTARGELDRAVATSPALEAALGNANRMYAQNIGRFRSALADGIISDVGEDGGLSGEAIVRRLTGSDARTNLQQLESILGRGATAGADMSNRGTELVREAILSTAGTAGRRGGAFNVGNMVSTVERVLEQLPPADRTRLFPNFGAMRQAMLREASIGQSQAATRNPRAFLRALNADPALLQRAFGAADAATAETLARQAVARGAAEQRALSNLGLDELADRNAFDVERFVIDPTNTPKIQNLVTRLQGRNPALLQDVRSSFIDRLMTEAQEGGEFSPQAFAELVRNPTGATRAGTYNESARALFGNTGLTDVQRTMAAMGEIPTPLQMNSDQRRGLGSYLLFGYTGGNALGGTQNSVVNTVGRLLTAYPEVRYRFASTFLTTPELRRAAMEPLDASSQQSLRTVSNLVSRQLLEKYGPKDERYKQAKEVEESLPNK